MLPFHLDSCDTQTQSIAPSFNSAVQERNQHAGMGLVYGHQDR